MQAISPGRGRRKTKAIDNITDHVFKIVLEEGKDNLFRIIWIQFGRHDKLLPEGYERFFIRLLGFAMFTAIFNVVGNLLINT